MRFDVLTLFPEFVNSYCDCSIIKRAVLSNIIQVNTINPRDFTHDKHRHVDDTPYGGGAGMVLMAEPYVEAYESIEQSSKCCTIMMTPQGTPFCNDIAKELSEFEQIIILCGHYEGYDERIRDIIQPKEISIGDFVLTGGELPALCIIDCVSRKLDGVLGKIESAQLDSFEDGLLEYPQYTKPREYRGLCVPEVLLNGNHQDIAKFRHKKMLERTKERRPDLYEQYQGNKN